MMPGLVHGIFDSLFPAYCVSCNRPVSNAMNGVCNECRNRVEYVHGGCSRCGAESDALTCDICADRIFFPSRSLIVAEYRGVMKDAVCALKFHGAPCVSGFLASRGKTLLHDEGIIPDIVTCVPMNRAKKKKRGYNQAELSARQLASLMELPFGLFLRENNGMMSQKKLSVRERFIHVIGRYRVVGEKHFHSKKVLLVDDVFTTGATLNECSRLLLEFGASEVYALTFARADIKGLKIEGADIS